MFGSYKEYTWLKIFVKRIKIKDVFKISMNKATKMCHTNRFLIKGILYYMLFQRKDDCNIIKDYFTTITRKMSTFYFDTYHAAKIIISMSTFLL